MFNDIIEIIKNSNYSDELKLMAIDDLTTTDAESELLFEQYLNITYDFICQKLDKYLDDQWPI